MPELSIGVPSQPFRGFEPLRLVDRDLFAARETETEALFRAVLINRGVLLYGSSGAGKSSLVNAGLIPLALAEGFAPHRVRVQPKSGAEFVFERISLEDHSGPPYVEPSLLAEDEGGKHAISSAELTARIRRFTAGKARPLLIFDQFEELITLFERTPGSDDRSDRSSSAKSVIDLVADLLAEETLPVKLVLAFREDYLGQIRRLFLGAPQLFRSYVALDSPKTDSVREIVTRPFRSNREGSFARALSVEVVNLLDTQFKARSSEGRVELSELQIVCSELWKNSATEALLEKSGVESILKGYLTQLIERIPEPEVRDAAVALLGLLVTQRGTRNVVSWYTLSLGLRQAENIDDALAHRALKQLIELGLVREEFRRAVYYEITSEFMGPWIVEQRTTRELEKQRKQLEKLGAQSRVSKFSLYTLPALLLGGLVVIWLAQRLAGSEHLREQLDLALGESATARRSLEVVASHAQERQAQKGSTMLGSMFDAVVGFGFVYALLGLVCTSLQEFLARALRLRARTFRAGVEELLGAQLAQEVLAHPLVQGLNRPEELAYVAPETLSLALADVLGGGDPQVHWDPSKLSNALERLPDQRLRRVLYALNAEKRPSEYAESAKPFWQAVSQWYSRAMDEVASRYAGRVRQTMLILGAVIAVTVNVDAGEIGRYFLDNPVAQAATTARLEALVQLADSNPSPEARARRSAEVTQAMNELSARGVPLGWTKSPLRNGSTSVGFLYATLGWVVSAIVISLSASAWFTVWRRLSRLELLR